MTALGPPRGQGRWSLVERELGPPATPAEAGIALASVLIERHGVVTRSTLRAEGVPGGFAGLYPVLRAMEDSGRVRRGYFVAGMGAAQFAHPAAVDRLRSVRDASGVQSATDTAPTRVLVLAATDPANVYGSSLPWPVKGPTRVSGAYVVLADGRACAYLERGGRGLVALRELDGTWEEPVVSALAALVRDRRWSRLVLQRYPEQLEPVLLAEGFTPSPRGLVHYGAAPAAVATSRR